jgi:hypothetical protein
LLAETPPSNSGRGRLVTHASPERHRLSANWLAASALAAKVASMRESPNWTQSPPNGRGSESTSASDRQTNLLISRFSSVTRQRVVPWNEWPFVCAAFWVAQCHSFVDGRRLSALVPSLDSGASAVLSALLCVAAEAAGAALSWMRPAPAAVHLQGRERSLRPCGRC